MEKIPLLGHWLQQIREQCTPDFLHGVMTGLILAILILTVLLLLFLLKWIRSFSITIHKDSQTVCFSGKTICAYIKNLIHQDGRLNVEKVVLKGRRASFRILLKVSMNEEVSDTFPLIVEQLRDKIFAQIRNSLGIGTLKSVDFELLAPRIPVIPKQE